MNLFIHGIDGNIKLGNSYFDDQHAGQKADYILANPPFNDGSKGDKGWGAERIQDKDPRLTLGAAKMPLSPRNANTMWILHFLYHLKEAGTAGFVMATGELSNSETARVEVRKTLVESEQVDCIVQLTGQLFANTQIHCALWLLSKNRNGGAGFRKRTGEILFKATVRAAVKRVLRKRDVKEEHFEFFLERIMEQAEAIFASWPLAA